VTERARGAAHHRAAARHAALLGFEVQKTRHRQAHAQPVGISGEQAATTGSATRSSTSRRIVVSQTTPRSRRSIPTPARDERLPRHAQLPSPRNRRTGARARLGRRHHDEAVRNRMEPTTVEDLRSRVRAAERADSRPSPRRSHRERPAGFCAHQASGPPFEEKIPVTLRADLTTDAIVGLEDQNLGGHRDVLRSRSAECAAERPAMPPPTTTIAAMPRTRAPGRRPRRPTRRSR
jgi:hypothetical protein